MPAPGKICSISHLPIYRREKWIDIRLGSDYTASFYWIGEQILVSAPKGVSGLEEIEAFFLAREKVIQEGPCGKKNYIEIKDYSGITKNPGRPARNLFTDRILNDKRLIGYYGYNNSPFIRGIFNLAAKFIRTKKAYSSVRDHEAAVRKALELLNQESASTISFSKSEDIQLEGVRVRIKWLKHDVLYFAPDGEVRPHHTEYFRRITERFLKKNPVASRGYYKISDYSGLRYRSPQIPMKITSALKELNRKYPCRLSLVYGIPVFFRATFRLASLVLPFRIQAAKDLREALKIIDQKRSRLEKENDNRNPEIQRLLHYIGRIAWDRKHRGTRDKISSSNPFHPVYEALDLIEQDIANMYKVDELTSLPNRYMLIDDISSRRKVRLLIIGISNFNDLLSTFGGNISQDLILKTSDRLKVFTAKYGKLYKFKIDDFGLVVSKNTFRLKSFYQSLQKFFTEHPVTYRGLPIPVELAVGQAVDDPQTVTDRAYDALVSAREPGNDCFADYEEGKKILDTYSNNINWAIKIKEGIADNRLVPYFHAIHDNHRKRTRKYECLARLVEGNQVISPFNFLDPAEKAGLICDLTHQILDKSLNFFSTRKDEFSINLTEKDLLEKENIRDITKKLKRSAISPRRVTFEVLENFDESRHDIIMNSINELKKTGASIAVDDFGSGYSNFSRLFDISFDYLKIDGSLIRDINTNRQSCDIVRTITELGHTIGAKVIAEYVHSSQVQNKVVEVGADYSQGFYFSEPKAEL